VSRILRDSKPVARKEYDCEASDWLLNSNMGEEDMTPEEWQTIKNAEAERFKILPGRLHVSQAGIYEGEFYTFRARIDINDICLKYDIYEE